MSLVNIFRDCSTFHEFGGREGGGSGSRLGTSTRLRTSQETPVIHCKHFMRFVNTFLEFANVTKDFLKTLLSLKIYEYFIVSMTCQ